MNEINNTINNIVAVSSTATSGIATTKTIVTLLGVVVAAMFAYRFYSRLANTSGINALSKTSLAFRLVISVFSFGVSFNGVLGYSYNFLTVNMGVNSLTAGIISLVLALATGAAIEFMSIHVERAIYEAWFVGFKRFLTMLFTLALIQGVNFSTMYVNMSLMFDKIMSKKSHKIESLVVDTRRYQIEQTKVDIANIREQISKIHVAWQPLYKNSVGYAKYNRLYKKYINKAHNPNLQKLAEKGNKWAKAEIRKYKKLASTQIDKLDALKQAAKAKAKRLEDEKRETLRDELQQKLGTISKAGDKALKEQQKQIAEAKRETAEKTRNIGILAGVIVLLSIYLSIIHTMTNKKVLTAAKAIALQDLEEEIAFQHESNKLQAALNEAKALRGEIAINPRPTQADGGADVEIDMDSVFVEKLDIEEPAKEEADFNEELWRIAEAAAIDGKHPNREALKDLASGYGLDTKSWNDKYRDYLAVMRKKGRIEQDEDGGYILKGKTNVEVA